MILYHNVTILTLTEQQAEAMVVEAGRIVKLGEYSQLVREFPQAEQVDLQGATMMPAFLDAHSHYTQVANSFMQISLAGVTTPEELGQRVQKYIQSECRGEHQWIMARDFDDALFGGYPELEWLDSVTLGHPMLISQKSGHMGMLNSEAMKELSIDGNTAQIEGGRIEMKEGKPTGYLEENAFFHYQKQVPMPSMEQFITAFQRAQDLYESYGIHTFQEGMLVKEMIPLYQLLLSQNILKLDLVAYPDVETYPLVKQLFQEHMHGYHRHLRIGGIKIFLDGSPQGRTAWMRTSYAGTNDCGYGTMTDEELLQAFYLAGEEQVQLLAHCNGDAACEQFLNCLEKAEKVYPNLKTLRPVIIHGQLLGTDQMKRVKELGAMVSFFVAHVYYFGDIHRKNFSMERAKDISPAQTALEEGVMFTFHQDAPVLLPDMWETIWCAMVRKTKEGVLLGENQRISLKEAIQAVTKHAAYQYGEEADKGVLEVGKKADFILLDKNPFLVPVEELREFSKYIKK